ncbi:MAG TPA: putative inorganic carbon transporter subunit DabA, partial [Planctomycetaceae bacterium]|nr:putative inorganic carbon transporter subunit DabA [Planctomycetaceae bacterium]
MNSATTIAASPVVDSIPADSATLHDELKRAIDDAAKLLPVQGPITVLVALNTLQALEDRPYDEAVLEGSRLFGGEPYLPENVYRAAMDRDRIRQSDLEASLRTDLRERADQTILDLCTRLELRLGMLRHPLRQAPTAELRWFVAETDALSRYRDDVEPAIRSRFLDDTRHWAMREVLPAIKSPLPAETSRQSHLRLGFANLFVHFGVDRVEQWSLRTWEAFALQALWRVCRDGLHGLKPVTPSSPPIPSVRLRDWLFDESGQDSDRLVHEVLIRFCAAFLDQGLSPWPLPNRSAGFLKSFCQLYGQPGGLPTSWLRGLPTELRRISQTQLTALDCIAESLRMMAIPSAEWHEYIKTSILALRGWAGMIYQVETRPDRAAVAIPEGTLVEYLAVRLLLERQALLWTARESLGFDGSLGELRGSLRKRHHRDEKVDVEQRAFLVFQVAQLFGWSSAALQRLSKPEWQTLIDEIESFTGVERRRIF